MDTKSYGCVTGLTYDDYQKQTGTGELWCMIALTPAKSSRIEGECMFGHGTVGSCECTLRDDGPVNTTVVTHRSHLNICQTPQDGLMKYTEVTLIHYVEGKSCFPMYIFACWLCLKVFTIG